MSTIETSIHEFAQPDIDAPETDAAALNAPALSVVEGRRDAAGRLVRFLGATLLVTVIVGLVGALVLHATIIETQRELDNRQDLIDALEADTVEMRHELATLEAPARIVASAKAFGMIEAPEIVYLQSSTTALNERTLGVAAYELEGAG